MNNSCPIDYVKPTIQTKVIKLEDGTDFVLEYPTNYNEIVDKKLAKLDSEYNETISANITSSVNNEKQIDEEQMKLEGNDSIHKHEQEMMASTSNGEMIHQEKDDKRNEEDIDDDKNESKGNDIEGYQQIGGYNQLNDEQEDEFIEVKEDDLDTKSKQEDNNLENCKEQQVINTLDGQQNSIINKVEDKKVQSDSDMMNCIEFVEEPIKKEIKRKCSPIKNPEKIKETMRSIKIKPPKWAENLTDEEFIQRAKQFLFNK